MNAQKAHTKSKHFHIHPSLVCLSGALFFFYVFIQMNLFNAISQPLMHTFSIGIGKLGLFSSGYLWALTISLIPAGLLFDRFSTRRLLLTSAVVCVICTLLFSATQILWQATTLRILIGITHAFASLGALRLATRWYPAERRALVIGLVLTIAISGGIVAQTPLTIVTDAFGWRNAVLFDGALGIFIILMIWLFVYSRPEEQPAIAKSKITKETTTETPAKHLSFWRCFKESIIGFQNWLCGIYTSFLNLPLMVIGALWGDLYLTQAHHLSSTQASKVTAMIFLGMIIGSPCAGWISDALKRRRLPMIIGAIISIIVIFYIAYSPHLNYDSLLWLFFILGVVTSTQIIAYPTIAELNPLHLTSTAMGLQSVIIMGGAAVAQPLFGWLISLNWIPRFVGATAVFSVWDYRAAMTMLPIAFLIALFAAFLIRETHAKQMQAIPAKPPTPIREKPEPQPKPKPKKPSPKPKRPAPKHKKPQKKPTSGKK